MPKPHRETFSQMTARVPHTEAGTPMVILTPIADGSWRASDGSDWHRRGDLLDARSIKKLAADPAVRVLLVNLDRAKEYGPDEREALWQHVEPILTGANGTHSWLEAARFRDAAKHQMLVIEEHC